MSLRLLTLTFALFLTASCLGPHVQEPYINDAIVAKITDGEYTFVVYEHVRGEIYWVPVQDVNRTKFKSFIVEIKRLNAKTGQTVTLSCDLMKRGEADQYHPPNFIGASSHYGFWGNEGGYNVIDFNTAEVSYIRCERRFLMSGDWTAHNPTSIRRTTRDGVFELSVDVAREIKP